MIDSIVGLGVSVLIIIAGFKIFLETMVTILGEAPVNETVDAIEKIVKEYPEIIGIHDMMVHDYGAGRSIASFHAEVNGEDDIYLLHDTIELYIHQLHFLDMVHPFLHIPIFSHMVDDYYQTRDIHNLSQALLNITRVIKEEG